MNQTHHSTYGDGKPDSEKSPERLQHEVDEARERLGARLDTLSHRLSPGELLDQALSMAKQHGGEFGHNLGTQAKQNPLPLVLTSIGLSWLMMGTRAPQPQGQAYTVGDHPSMGDRASGVLDKAKGAMSGAAEHARDMRHSLHDRAGGMHERAGGAVDSARWRAQAAQQQMNTFLRDQPVLAGSLGIALGAALGAMLPHSRQEDEMLGDASEQAKSRAMAAGGEQYDKAREKGREVLDSAKEKVHEASSRSAGQTPGESPRTGSADTASQAAGGSGAGASSSGTDTSADYRARGSGTPSSDQRKDSEGGTHPSRF